MSKFKVGDKVRMIGGDLAGTVISVHEKYVWIRYDNLTPITCNDSSLQLVPEDDYPIGTIIQSSVPSIIYVKNNSGSWARIAGVGQSEPYIRRRISFDEMKKSVGPSSWDKRKVLRQGLGE